MISGDVRQFLDQLAVIPTHRDLFGREATLEDVVGLLKKYPVTEWLSYLARIQCILGADHVGEAERIKRVICGTMPHAVRKTLREFEQQLRPGQKLKLYYERQLSTLQQLAILHAPEADGGLFESEEGRNDLSTALLMTADVMRTGRPQSHGVGALLPIAVQDQIRMSTTPSATYAARAFHFYELDRNERSPEVSKYLELFEQASGVSAIDCILGALVIVIREETRSLDEIADTWHTVPRLNKQENPKEAAIIDAYKAVRMKPLSDLRDLIREREKDRLVRDWNLIALSQAPICDLGDRGAFVLNHTALGRSLFDSVRHTILTAALGKRLPRPYTNEQSIGRLYGKIFESYVFSVLQCTCPERVWPIPADTHRKRSDFLIWFPDKVIIVEVKGVHFVGTDHASLLSIAERGEELQKIGMHKAIDQLGSTIHALRCGDIVAPSMPSYDWTITPIIPVIVTEEQMPQVPGCWDAFYRLLCEGIERLTAAGPLGKLRLLTIGDVERLPDLQAPDDLGTMLFRWGTNQGVMELTWSRFLQTQNISFQRSFISTRFFEAMNALAQRLGLGETKLVMPSVGSKSAPRDL